MRRDRDRRDAADFGDEGDNFLNGDAGDARSPGAAAEMQVRAMWLVDEVIRLTPRNDPRLGYMLALREQLETDEAMMDEARKVIAEFEEAYTKLTSPANT